MIKIICSLCALLLVACSLFTGSTVIPETIEEQIAPTLTSLPPTEVPPEAQPSPSPESITGDDQLALQKEWSRAIASVEIMFAICETTYNNHALLQKGAIDQEKAQSELDEKADFLAEVQKLLSEWVDVSPRVDPYFHTLDNLSYEMADLMSRLMSGEIGSEEITQPLDDTCLSLFNAQDEVIRAAMDAGLTADSIMKLEMEGINDILNQIYD